MAGVCSPSELTRWLEALRAEHELQALLFLGGFDGGVLRASLDETTMQEARGVFLMPADVAPPHESAWRDTHPRGQGWLDVTPGSIATSDDGRTVLTLTDVSGERAEGAASQPDRHVAWLKRRFAAELSSGVIGRAPDGAAATYPQLHYTAEALRLLRKGAQWRQAGTLVTFEPADPR